MSGKNDALISQLGNLDQLVALALQIGGTLAPLVVGLVKEIKSVATPTGDIEYTVVLKVGKDSLDKAEASFEDTLALVNAELVRMGKPPLDVPSTT